MQDTNVVGFRGAKIDLIIVDDVEIKKLPKVGDTLAIAHEVKRGKAGEVLGMRKINGNASIVPITAVYLDGSVRTGKSDVWNVVPGGSKVSRGANWVTEIKFWEN